MGKQNLQAKKVYYRCFYIAKEAVNMKYVVVAENAIIIFDTQTVYKTCWGCRTIDWFSFLPSLFERRSLSAGLI